jgi:hypothetical protein
VKTISIPFWALFFIFAICIFFISCVLPVYVPPNSGGGLIDRSVVKPGITTKEDVFLQLGCRFWMSQDEKFFTARYTLDKGFSGILWFIGAGYSGTGGVYNPKNLTAVYETEIEFDENDVVKKCEEFKLPRDKSQEKKSIENK